MTPDQEALVLLLETVRGHVGYDVQREIDEVLIRLKALPPETAKKNQRTFLIAGVALLTMLVAAVIYGYIQWTAQPLIAPRAEGETLVLVADILVPGCVNDPACPADPDADIIWLPEIIDKLDWKHNVQPSEVDEAISCIPNNGQRVPYVTIC